MYFLDDPKGGSVFQKGSLYYLVNHMYRSFPSLSEQVFSSDRMLYSTKEHFAMRKSFAMRKKVLL